MGSVTPAATPRAYLWARLLALAAVYLVCSVLLDAGSKSIQRMTGVSAFFPGDGLALAVVYVVGLRFVPMVFLAYTLATLALHGIQDIPTMLGASAMGAALHGSCVLLLRRVLHSDVAQGRVRDLALFLAGVATVAVVGAGIITGALVLSEEVPRSVAGGVFYTVSTGLGIGMVMMAPGGALVAARVRAWLGGEPLGLLAQLAGEGWRRLAKDALLLLATTAITVLVAFSSRARTVEPLYLCFLPIIWLALRRGLPGAVVAIMVVDTAVVLAFHARGLPPPELDKIQLLQVALSLTGLVLGAVVTEREAAQAAARGAEGLRRELELARRIQTGVLPIAPALPGFELAGSMEPASHVGGDFYDVVHLDDGGERFWVMIGDVSGHGLDAGLVMLMAQAAAQATLRAQPDMSPRQLVAHVNRVLHENVRRRMKHKGFVTFMAMRHDGGGRFVAAGGHLPVFVIRRDGPPETLEPVGPWCGIRPEIEDQLEQVELSLAPGDVLCLITDGIIEAHDRAGQMFGEERLLDTLEGASALPSAEALTRVLARVRAFQTVQEDDMTVVVLKRTATADATRSAA